MPSNTGGTGRKKPLNRFFIEQEHRRGSCRHGDRGWKDQGRRPKCLEFRQSLEGRGQVRHHVETYAVHDVRDQGGPPAVYRISMRSSRPQRFPSKTRRRRLGTNTPVYRMLIRILEIASAPPINDYTQRKLGGPIGMSNSAWQCGPAPGGKTNCTWYRSTLRDMSRLGLLISRHGKWENRQLIKPSFLKEATGTSQKLNEAYGLFWWLNGRPPPFAGRAARRMLWPTARLYAFGALGAQDKKIYIVPSLDLVIARHGGPSGVSRNPGSEGGGGDSFDNELLGRIVGQSSTECVLAGPIETKTTRKKGESLLWLAILFVSTVFCVHPQTESIAHSSTPKRWRSELPPTASLARSIKWTPKWAARAS